MSNLKLTIGLVVVAVIAIAGLFLPQIKVKTSVFGSASSCGGSTTCLTGNLTVETSNTATSTLTAGCVQTYATSTFTPIALQFSKSHVATTTFSGTAFGNVVWQFGSCPK